HGMPFHQGSNLRRQPVDYGELHCQLVEVEPTLRLQAFDEELLEVGEVDSGLTWARAGLGQWFEPTSVVHFQIDAPIAAEDIRLSAWRCNMRSILAGYRYFEQKWGIDITERGRFRRFLFVYNRQLGLLPRLFPSPLTLRIDHAAGRLRRGTRAALAPLRAPQWGAANLRAWWVGYHARPRSPPP